MRLLILSAALIAAPAAANPIKPGQWQTSSTITAIDMPTDPGGIAKSMLGKVTTSTACITPAQAAIGTAELLKATKGQCRYDKMVIAGGRIDAVMSCGPGLSTTLSGTMTPTSYAVTGRTRTPQMTMTTATKAKWAGACK